MASGRNKSCLTGADGQRAACRDDWDQHWDEFAKASDAGPTPKYRSREILKLLAVNTPSNVRLLEIGSGMGEFAATFQERFPSAQYLGLELSEVGVRISKARVPGAQFVQRDLLDDAVRPEARAYKATHAVCSEVLEHIDDPAVLLRNASAYMDAGCRLVVTVPGGPMNAFYKSIGHRRHYSSKEIGGLLRSCGFTVERAYDAGFPFFNLFRCLLSIRGERLLQDVAGDPSFLTKFVLRVFGWLFYLDLKRYGWQVFAVAVRS